MRWALALSAMGLLALPVSARAQGDTARPRAAQPPRPRKAGGGRGAALGADPATPVDRQALERAVRQAMNRQIRRQLNLNDEQMRSLQQTDAKFQKQRTQLLRDERETRQALKTAMEDSTARDQSKISQHLDRLVQIQRQRAELLDAEQKDLAGFLTPMQRAQFLALRERLAKRLQQEPPGGRAGGPPPPLDDR